MDGGVLVYKEHTHKFGRTTPQINRIVKWALTNETDKPIFYTDTAGASTGMQLDDGYCSGLMVIRLAEADEILVSNF